MDGYLAKPRRFIPGWMSSASSGIKVMRKHLKCGQSGAVGAVDEKCTRTPQVKACRVCSATWGGR